MQNSTKNQQLQIKINTVKKQSVKIYQQFFDVSSITKNLYIGDKNISLNKQHLLKLNIKRIVTAGQQLQTKFSDDFKYLKLEIKDSIKTNLFQILPITNKFINQGINNKQNILIHCAFGVSRSASVLIGYLIFKYKMSYQQAYHFAKQRRPQIKPNQGFASQLKKYSFQLNKK